jgi:hypothetical protein
MQAPENPQDQDMASNSYPLPSPFYITTPLLQEQRVSPLVIARVVYFITSKL